MGQMHRGSGAGAARKNGRRAKGWYWYARAMLATVVMAVGAFVSVRLRPALYSSIHTKLGNVPSETMRRWLRLGPQAAALALTKQAALRQDANSSVSVALKTGLPSVASGASAPPAGPPRPPGPPGASATWATGGKSAVPGDGGGRGDVRSASDDVTSSVMAALAGVKFNTDEQQVEYDEKLVSFQTGADSCNAVCASKQRVCARDWFLYIDTCSVAQAALAESRLRLRCSEVTHPAVPMALGQRAQLLVSRDSKADPPTCEARPWPQPGQQGQQGLRLCACVPPAHRRDDMGKAGESAVADVVKKVLEELDAHQRLEVARATVSGANHQVELDDDGTQVSSRMLADVTAGRVSFFKGAVTDTCEATCKTHKLKCAAPWFKTLNRCEVMMAAYPQTPDGSYLSTCGSQFYGHDLPGYQTEMKQLLLNNDIENFPTTCGGRGDFTGRLCPCAYKYPNTRVTYHTVFNVQSKQYFEWQSRYSFFWHKQVGQPGKITRLLSMGGKWPTDPRPHPTGDHLMKEVPTHIAPQYDYSIDNYVAYNKPLSITHWLQTTDVKEDVIIIADPDCAYINKLDYPVDEGSPIATQGYYSFKSKTSVEYQIASHYCKGICKHFDPIAVPVVIHRNDLARLAPLWLKYTEDVRRDREGPNKWPIEWNDNRFTVNRIEWVAEMFGYVIAAAHLDLRHEMVDLQLVPSVHKRLTPGVPFLHYHVRIETADHKFWNKGDDHAGQRFPWPVAEGTDPVTHRLLQALHDAYTAVGETDRTQHNKWANYFSEWDNPQHEASRRRTLLAVAGALSEASWHLLALPAINSSELSEA